MSGDTFSIHRFPLGDEEHGKILSGAGQHATKGNRLRAPRGDVREAFMCGSCECICLVISPKVDNDGPGTIDF